ncbi:MAG: hypothetical protein ACR2HX_01170 [Pyrinomonadaceae bacterium]
MASDQPYPGYVEGPDYAQYVALRTMLDSLEIGALRYYLDNTSPEEKRKRFEELSFELKPILKRLWGVEKITIAGECPDGYFNCDGVCVPYACLQ